MMIIQKSSNTTNYQRIEHARVYVCVYVCPSVSVYESTRVREVPS